MKLEKTEYPTHSLDLPYSKKTINFRSWNMMEHKPLVMAFEGKDQRDIQKAMMQILTNIVIDGTDVGKLAAIEFDYLFLRARAKSVGERIPISIEHAITKQKRLVPIDLMKLDITPPPDREYKIPIKDDDGKDTAYFLMMKELSAEDRLDILNMKSRDPNILEEIETILRCIDRVCDATECIDAKDQAKELRTLITTMSPKRYENLDNFITSMPIIRYDINVKGLFPKTEEEKASGLEEGDSFISLEGIESFFD